jgi:hypothetical protein
MSSNILSTRRLALLSAGVSLFGAAAAFGAGPGGSISISSSPALSLGASGLTQGLIGTVWHVPGAGPVGSGQYGIPSDSADPTGGYGPAPTLQDVGNVETYLNQNGFYWSSIGVTEPLPAAAYTFLNTADTFNYSGNNGSPTSSFLGADAAGAATLDDSYWARSIVDQMGYVKIAQAGTYNFTMSSADDAGAVYIGGTGITPIGNAGTGTQVVALGYNSNFTPPPASGTYIPAADGTANVTFSSAGYYPIEIMNYQQGGGAGLNFSVTPPSGGTAPTYYTTTAAASAVTSFPTPVPAAPPAPTDEWNFGKSAISGSTVSDIGTAGSASTAGTIVGTGNTISGGALVTSNSNSGNGMSVPGSTFANYTGDFTISVTYNRSASDPTNDWGSLFAMGTQGGKSDNFILIQPQRHDGTNWSSDTIQTDGSQLKLHASNGLPSPAGQLTQEVLVYNSGRNTLSLYINGSLQMFGTPILTDGTSALSLAAIADPSGATASDGLGGLDPFGDSTTLASYYDLSTWNSALTANQVSGLFAGAAVPEPGDLALLGLGAMGLLLLSRPRHAKA